MSTTCVRCGKEIEDFKVYCKNCSKDIQNGESSGPRKKFSLALLLVLLAGAAALLFWAAPWSEEPQTPKPEASPGEAPPPKQPAAPDKAGPEALPPPPDKVETAVADNATLTNATLDAALANASQGNLTLANASLAAIPGQAGQDLANRTANETEAPPGPETNATILPPVVAEAEIWVYYIAEPGNDVTYADMLVKAGFPNAKAKGEWPSGFKDSNIFYRRNQREIINKMSESLEIKIYNYYFNHHKISGRVKQVFNKNPELEYLLTIQ